MEKWYKKHGFFKNPLNIEAKHGEKIFGYDVLLNELFYRINSGNMIFLEGNISKTSILYAVIDKYKGKGRVAYVDCNKINDELNIKELLSHGKPSINAKLPGYPKKMIVLLDNVHNLSNKNSEMIKFYFDQNNILSIIMTSDSYEKCSIPDSVKHRIGNRVYKTRDLTFSESVEIILNKLKYGAFIMQNQIEKIALSNENNGIKKTIQEVDLALFLMRNANEEKMTNGIIERLLHMPDKERKLFEF